jgi:hypothetical protein
MRDVLFEPQIAQNTQILISDIEVGKAYPTAAIHLPLKPPRSAFRAFCG